MGDMWDELTDAVKQAVEIVAEGDAKKGDKIPAPQADVEGSMKKAKQALSDVNKARNDMAAKVQTYENSLDKIRNDLVAFRGKLAKEKFGLDESKPDDKKKIEAARKALDDGIGDVLDEVVQSETKVEPIDDLLQQEIK